MSRKPRILYLTPDIVLDFPKALSEHLTGDYVTIWLRGRDADAAEDRALVESSFGEFRFRPMLPSRLPPGLKQLHELAFYIRTGLALSRREGAYDAIICYSPYRTAIAGVVLRALTGARLLVEYPQDPVNVYRHLAGRAAKVKQWLSPKVALWVARRSDHVVELFPRQLDPLLGSERRMRSVIPPFTRLSRVPAGVPREPRSIVLLGSPPHLKGVDVLLKAFRRVVEVVPDATLRLAGWATTPPDLLALAEGLPVQFLGRLGHGEALRLIASARVFTLPSRTEVMPRVLIEAMAAGAAVVGSDVGGIPSLIRDGETGFVVPAGDDAALADRLIRLLSDDALADRFVAAARERVRHEFSERAVARGWAAAVHAALSGAPVEGRVPAIETR